MRILIALVLALLPGCLPWGDAGDWAEAPDGVVSWEWILDVDSLPPAPSSVDLFGMDGLEVGAGYVDVVASTGASPWCYLSVGTAEEFRDDYDAFANLDVEERAAGNEGVLGGVLPDWQDERWLNLRRADVLLPLMESRLDVCEDKGFTLVEFDNMDGHTNETGLDLTAQEVRTWVASLIALAVDRGLGVIHKNASDLTFDLEPSVEALLLESCVLDGFCGEAALPFIESGKPVMNAEYPGRWRSEGRRFNVEDVCAESESAGVSTLVKTLDLDDRSIVCAAL